MSIDLSPCQTKALSVLQSRSGNIFLTGHAGSGKSFLIRHFLRQKDRKRFPIVASTGAAAVLVGGRTFHSFFGLGIMEGGVERTVASALGNRRVKSRLRQIEGFVLDEISMIPAPALRAAETICRKARKEEAPWGGARVIAVGDFCQLPPIAQGNQRREWAFLDETWKRSCFEPLILKTIVRSHDEDYIRVLNRIRDGQIDDEVEAYLNRKTDPDAVDSSQTHLFSRRRPTEAFNRMRLEEIKKPFTVIPTHYEASGPEIERFKKAAPIPDVLQLKPGALVMLRINDPQWRFVNGSVGILEEITKDRLSIRLHNRRMVDVEKSTFSWLDAEGEVIATATNFPLNLAYALTIHKAQGTTLDNLVVGLKGLWDPGQAYVALSRLKSGAGLTLTGWNRESITVDPEVVRFYEGLEARD